MHVWHAVVPYAYTMASWQVAIGYELWNVFVMQHCMYCWGLSAEPNTHHMARVTARAASQSLPVLRVMYWIT